MKNLFKRVLPIASFTAAFLLFILAIVAVIAYKRPIYEGEYTTAQVLVRFYGGKVLEGPCTNIKMKLYITKDTVILSDKDNAIGFKPVEFKGKDIRCIRADSAEVFIIRTTPPENQRLTSDEVLFVIQPENTLFLTKEASCRNLERN